MARWTEQRLHLLASDANRLQYNRFNGGFADLP